MTEASAAESQQKRAYEHIRKGIIYADYKPGERLSMKGLGETLELGRTPVREALVRLQQEGLVHTVPQSGTYVSLINLRLAESARFVRENLEKQVVVECCSRLDEHAYRAIDDVIQEQISAAERTDEIGFFVNDNLFHCLLFQVAGRSEVWNWLDSLSVSLDRIRWLSACTEGLKWQTVLDQHLAICDAIVNRDPGEARYIMSLHLHKVLGDKRTIINRFPEYFEEGA